MKDTSRFYLATNPFNINDNSMIIHIDFPKCMIEVLRENNLSKRKVIEAPHQCFFHINSKGHPESWVFILTDTFSINDRSFDYWKPIIQDAWNWFNNYLHLTYKLNKENEKSKLN